VVRAPGAGAVVSAYGWAGGNNFGCCIVSVRLYAILLANCSRLFLLGGKCDLHFDRFHHRHFYLRCVGFEPLAVKKTKISVVMGDRTGFLWDRYALRGYPFFYF
jgi:hypothetical protein